MSYVYMKALEKKATKYDRGIRILTLGRLTRIKQEIIDSFLAPQDSILDIGMGTGTFAVMCAQSGKNLTIIGIDQSDSMVNVAQKHIQDAQVKDSVKTMHLPVVEMDSAFSDGSFDKVTALLSFSEMYPAEQQFCLQQIYRILKPNGQFILVDETRPHSWWKRMFYFLIRIPLAFFTFMITNLSTAPLKNIHKGFADANFELIKENSYLLDSLTLFVVKKKD